MAWDVALLTFAAYACYGTLVQMLTVFTEEGVGRPGLRGRIALRWPEVKQFEETDLGFRLIADHSTIGLARALLQDPQQFREEIMRRLSSSALEPNAADLAAFRTAYGRYIANLVEYDAHLTMVPQATLDLLGQLMSATDDLYILLDPASDGPAVTRALARLAPLVGLSPMSSPGLVLAELTELVTSATPEPSERP